MREYKAKTEFLTWRELSDAISQLPEDVLDLEASVWLPMDISVFDEFQRFVALSAYDYDQPISPDNPPSLSIGR